MRATVRLGITYFHMVICQYLCELFGKSTVILFDASSLEATVERDCNFLGAYGLITFTIRSVECVLLTSKAHCEACEKYNSTLRASLSRHVRGGRERKVNGGRVHMVPGQRWCRLDSGLKGTTPVSTRFNKVRQERFNKKGSTRKDRQRKDWEKLLRFQLESG